jgi:uncharacterized RDD family membrane protein YckC
MGRCSVTGKAYPEDELVTFQGQLVSAEGKQILLDRLQTGADMSDELGRPGVWRRFGCIFLDGILLTVFAFLLRAMMGVPFIAPATDPKFLHQRIAADSVVFAVEILYFGLLHGWQGKSIGKIVGHLRVVNLDGTSISKRKAFGRAIAYEFGGLMIVLASIFGVGLGNSVIVLSGLILGLVWIATDNICALADARLQRSLHDRICGTRVIFER